MAIPLDFLRGLLGALQIFFCYALGKAAVGTYKGKFPKGRLLTPALRVAVTGAAVLWRVGFDVIAIIVFVLAAAAVVVGAHEELRRRERQDLSKMIFPEK